MARQKTPLTRRAIEQVAENRIREAMERGDFDHLPGRGRPIVDLDEPYDPDWWIKKWIRRERLRALPRELEELRRGRRRDAAAAPPDAASGGSDE